MSFTAFGFFRAMPSGCVSSNPRMQLSQSHIPFVSSSVEDK